MPSIVLALIGLMWGCGPSQMPAEVSRLVVQGNQALLQSDYRGALIYADSISAAGGRVESRFLKGRAFFELGDYPVAESLFTLVANEEPTYPGVHHNLGNIFYFRKQYRLALDNFLEEAGQRDDPRTWHAVAGVYSELGRLDSAETAVEKSISLDGGYAPAWLSRSRYAEQSGRLDIALEYANQAFLLDSTDTNTWLVLARLENQVGNASWAASKMQQLAQMDPWSYTALFELGRAYQRLGQPDVSSQLFERSNQLREIMQPIELLENSVAAEPSNFAQRIRLADANRQVQRFEQAARHYQAGLTLRPDNLDLASNLGTLYLQMGQKNNAIDLFRSVLNRDPQHLNTLLNLALMRLEEKDFRQSRIFFEKATAIDSNHPLLDRIRKMLEENGA